MIMLVLRIQELGRASGVCKFVFIPGDTHRSDDFYFLFLLFFFIFFPTAKNVETRTKKQTREAVEVMMKKGSAKRVRIILVMLF